MESERRISYIIYRYVSVHAEQKLAAATILVSSDVEALWFAALPGACFGDATHSNRGRQSVNKQAAIDEEGHSVLVVCGVCLFVP